MGHLEYSSPECLNLRDLVSYDIAGDLLLNQALTEMGVEDQVAFLKNNVDHHTGATFGCHENYLMRRETDFTPARMGGLLSFLASRQIFSGAWGRRRRRHSRFRLCRHTRRWISNSASGRITSSTRSTNGCSSTARLSMR